MTTTQRVPVRKRLFDLGIGLPLAVVLTPLILMLAIGSAWAYRAWPFFTQQRLGRGGRHFRFVKIRSLPTSAPTTADKYAIQRVENNQWGRTIRRFHLDELPQLWLVVVGRMSVVGPRPEMPELSANYDQEFVRERLMVRPGCTGLWQLSTAARGLIGEAPDFDLHYVRAWTLRLDIWALFRSVRGIDGRRPIETIGEIPAWTGTNSVASLEAAA